jgi:hypothetical protein
MRLDCQQCRGLQQIALAASKSYHERLQDLEAAYIRHNSEVVMLLSSRLESAFRSRNAAISELTNHESTCVGKKAAGVLPFRKLRSA